MHSGGFEPAVPASERLQTHALDRAATGIGDLYTVVSSGRGIGQSRRPLSHNTQHSQETEIHAPGGIRTRSPSKRGIPVAARSKAWVYSRSLSGTAGSNPPGCMDVVCFEVFGTGRSLVQRSPTDYAP